MNETQVQIALIVALTVIVLAVIAAVVLLAS